MTVSPYLEFPKDLFPKLIVALLIILIALLIYDYIKKRKKFYKKQK